MDIRDREEDYRFTQGKQYEPILKVMYEVGGPIKSDDLYSLLLVEMEHLYGPGNFELNKDGQEVYKNDARRVMQYWRERGFVVNVKDGVYTITSDGTEYVKMCIDQEELESGLRSLCGTHGMYDESHLENVTHYNRLKQEKANVDAFLSTVFRNDKYEKTLIKSKRHVYSEVQKSEKLGAEIREYERIFRRLKNWVLRFWSTRE